MTALLTLYFMNVLLGTSALLAKLLKQDWQRVAHRLTLEESNLPNSTAHDASRACLEPQRPSFDNPAAYDQRAPKSLQLAHPVRAA
jgi:hypothetical protein